MIIIKSLITKEYMRQGKTIKVIIPALNEERAIGKVIDAIPNWVDQIIVVDNGSDDRTAEYSKKAGAEVISEPVKGYGQACLSGIDALGSADIVVFLDGDYSDHPDEMLVLVEPILQNDADFVIGSRTRGALTKGALTPQQVFGNWLACNLIYLIWGIKYTDLGPFRAIRSTTLNQFDMSDKGYGWTIEMQIKAALHRIKTLEIPVSYRPRIGVSKISGTIKGSIFAGMKILSVIGLFFLRNGTRSSLSKNKSNQDL